MHFDPTVGVAEGFQLARFRALVTAVLAALALAAPAYGTQRTQERPTVEEYVTTVDLFFGDTPERLIIGRPHLRGNTWLAGRVRIVHRHQIERWNVKVSVVRYSTRPFFHVVMRELAPHTR